MGRSEGRSGSLVVAGTMPLQDLSDALEAWGFIALCKTLVCAGDNVEQRRYNDMEKVVAGPGSHVAKTTAAWRVPWSSVSWYPRKLDCRHGQHMHLAVTWARTQISLSFTDLLWLWLTTFMAEC